MDVDAPGFMGRPLAERSGRKRSRSGEGGEGQDGASAGEGDASDSSSDTSSRDESPAEHDSDSDFELGGDEERGPEADAHALSDDAEVSVAGAV